MMRRRLAQGFYGWLDRGYSRLLAWAMRHRLVVASLALIVIASNVPLYQIVKQEYIPSDVDEAEFDVNVNAPEGTNLAAMNDAMLQVEKELLATPGVRLILATAGGSFIGGVNQGSVYVRIAPHEERKFSLTRFFSATIHGHPLGCFPRQLFAARCHAGDPQAPGQVRAAAVLRAQCSVIQHRRRQ